jgi:ABC-type sugar transport system substrate-binding protein
MIFAREVSDNLTSLVKKIDDATVANKAKRMGSFVVFLTDDEDKTQKQLKAIGKAQGLKSCVLATVDSPAGPKGYNIAKEADVTVVLYVGRKVQANYAFKKGELKSSDIEKIVGDIKLIIPEKK